DADDRSGSGHSRRDGFRRDRARDWPHDGERPCRAAGQAQRQGAADRRLVQLAGARFGGVRGGRSRGGRRPGHRPDRGDEALQRDQIRPRRAGGQGRAGERRPGQGEAAPDRGGTAVNDAQPVGTVAPTMPRAHVTGWGRYAPAQVLTNADLEKMVDTSDEWIRSRTGIRERRVAAAHETTASMGAVAGLRAIRTAGLEPDDIDVIILATLTPDYWMPSTAALVKEAIGNTRASAFDVMAACSGFVYGYATASANITAGLARHVLVI